MTKFTADDARFVRTAVDVFKKAIDAQLEWEALPVEYRQTRNGWAGYRGSVRITKFRFSEDGARTDVADQESRSVKTTVIDQ